MFLITSWACAEVSPRHAPRPSESGTLHNTTRAASSPLANVHRTITGVFPSKPFPAAAQASGSKLAIVLWPIFGFCPSRRRGSKDPRPAQRSVVPISQKLQVNQVIPGRENHQHQNESETNAEPDFLRALAERTPSDGLDAVEQKMTAIEHRYREQIEQPNTHRDDGRKIEQRDKASARNLT